MSKGGSGYVQGSISKGACPSLFPKGYIEGSMSMSVSKVTRIKTRDVYPREFVRGMFKCVVYIQEGFIKVSMSGDLVQRGRKYFQMLYIQVSIT